MKKLITIITGMVLTIASFNGFASQTDEEVVALVKQTKADIAKNAVQTFTKITNAEHPYKNKANPSLYVFVFDTDLTVVAHAIKKKVVGKNVKGKPDVKGKKFRDEMLAKAKSQGSGWVDYYFLNPKSKQTEHKKAYIELAKGNDGKEYIVGSGKYFGK